MKSFILFIATFLTIIATTYANTIQMNGKTLELKNHYIDNKKQPQETDKDQAMDLGIQNGASDVMHENDADNVRYTTDPQNRTVIYQSRHYVEVDTAPTKPSKNSGNMKCGDADPDLKNLCEYELLEHEHCPHEYCTSRDFESGHTCCFF